MTKRILVVDDESDIIDIVDVILGTISGHEILRATSGEEGLRQAREHRPDAILLDVRMPGIEGPEVFSRLQADPTTASIPVIFATASVQVHERAALLDLSPAGVIEKPFDPDTLTAQIERMLGWG